MSLIGRKSVNVLMLVSLMACLLVLMPLCAWAADNIGALVNGCFETSWTYRSGGVPSPPGGWALAGWAATSGGPQHYTGTSELYNGRPTDHRCKWEFAGTGVSGNNVIAKEVNWGSYTAITVKVYCGGRTWGGTTGAMKLGVDSNGGGTQWSDCGSNTTSRTSNDSTWAQISVGSLTKPGGATTFTIMLNAVPGATTWNCQFDKVEITGTQNCGTFAGSVKTEGGAGIAGASVVTAPGSYSATTNSSGNYTISNVPAGTYDLTASKTNYNEQTQVGKVITTNQTTTVNFVLSIAADTIGSLVNASFQTSWTYRAGGVPSAPGGWRMADWAATGGGPQYYTGAELTNGRPSDHRCKMENVGTGLSANNAIAKEVYWGSYTSVTVSVYCAGRTWGGVTGAMKLGIDADGGGAQWSDCGSNTVSRTSNDSTWAQISKTVSKPTGATTFTVMLNIVPVGAAWNSQFDVLAISASGPTGIISGTVKDVNNAAINGATVATNVGGYSTTTNSSGVYSLSGVAVGSYSVTASKSGYISQTNENVVVTSGATTTSNFNLAYTGHSKVGVHTVIGSAIGYGAFIDETVACSRPVAIVKSVDDYGAAYEAKQHSTATITIGRQNTINGWDMQGLDGWLGGTAQAAANTIYPYLKAKWQQNSQIDIWELCNEWNAHYDWQADYYIAMMDKAEADGYRVGLWSSSVGTPHDSVYYDVNRACIRAKAHGNHILCLHEYALDGDPALLQNAPTTLVLRYRTLYTYLSANGGAVPIAITECGQNGGYDFVGDALFIQDFTWYDTKLRENSYVIGCAAWTLGTWAQANFETALPELADYICSQ